MFSSNKKGVGEIVSYVLLTLLVLVASLGAYIFSKNLFHNNLIEADTKRMHDFLKKTYYEIEEMNTYDGSSKTIFFRFDTGEMNINKTSIYFQSLQTYTGDDICFGILCYTSQGGYERSYITLSNLNFSSNITVRPDSYQMFLQYNKNGSKISVQFK